CGCEGADLEPRVGALGRARVQLPPPSVPMRNRMVVRFLGLFCSLTRRRAVANLDNRTTSLLTTLRGLVCPPQRLWFANGLRLLTGHALMEWLDQAVELRLVLCN